MNNLRIICQFSRQKPIIWVLGGNRTRDTRQIIYGKTNMQLALQATNDIYSVKSLGKLVLENSV